MRQIVALDQPADAHRSAALAALDHPEAEAVPLIGRDEPLLEVSTRGLEGTHPAIPDVAHPPGIVQQGEHEGRVVRLEVAKREALRFQHFHRASL